MYHELLVHAAGLSETGQSEPGVLGVPVVPEDIDSSFNYIQQGGTDYAYHINNDPPAWIFIPSYGPFSCKSCLPLRQGDYYGLHHFPQKLMLV